MTIIGYEKQIDGTENLLVFDPMFHDANKVIKLVDSAPVRHRHPGDLLKAYRRGNKYLKRYNEFELLNTATTKEAIIGLASIGWSWGISERPWQFASMASRYDSQRETGAFCNMTLPSYDDFIERILAFLQRSIKSASQRTWDMRNINEGKQTSTDLIRASGIRIT
ncbi:hypothetical protein EYC84_003453 [Monilinia fructicola]|uniref:Uncharacterized protein n=1 Tax=Monilinia fructicola TaxID=38448 RepID=A0A5M9JW85_MONFR|nr:hypothetical protein EYC84_003453 [Monilinia fructicola]